MVGGKVFEEMIDVMMGIALMMEGKDRADFVYIFSNRQIRGTIFDFSYRTSGVKNEILRRKFPRSYIIKGKDARPTWNWRTARTARFCSLFFVLVTARGVMFLSWIKKRNVGHFQK